MLQLKGNKEYSSYSIGELIVLYEDYSTYVMGLEESGHPHALEARKELTKIKEELDAMYADDVEPDWEWMNDIARGR